MKAVNPKLYCSLSNFSTTPLIRWLRQSELWGLAGSIIKSKVIPYPISQRSNELLENSSPIAISHCFLVSYSVFPIFSRYLGCWLLEAQVLMASAWGSQSHHNSNLQISSSGFVQLLLTAFIYRKDQAGRQRLCVSQPPQRCDEGEIQNCLWISQVWHRSIETAFNEIESTAESKSTSFQTLCKLRYALCSRNQMQKNTRVVDRSCKSSCFEISFLFINKRNTSYVMYSPSIGSSVRDGIPCFVTDHRRSCLLLRMGPNEWLDSNLVNIAADVKSLLCS